MTDERAKWLIFLPAVTIMAVAVIAVVLTQNIVQVPQQPGQKAVKVGSTQVKPQTIDLTQPGNQPHRPARIKLFQPEHTFEIVGTDVTPGAQLHWVLVARDQKRENRMIFRALIGNPDAFGPIERGRVVRLGFVHFWSNPGHEGSIVVVLAIE